MFYDSGLFPGEVAEQLQYLYRGVLTSLFAGSLWGVFRNTLTRVLG